MVIDTSALLAVLLAEPEAPRFAAAIAADPRRLVSVASALELTMVVEARHGAAGGREFELLLHRIKAATVPVSADQLTVAQDAWRRFGKGRHPASLNYGDCFSYGLARYSGEPLLYKGEDFTKTDIHAVLP
ncbi:MAG: type II toxin-antitoxin system VapC family toxin [Sporichthyaceae bacterium]